MRKHRLKFEKDAQILWPRPQTYRDTSSDLERISDVGSPAGRLAPHTLTTYTIGFGLGMIVLAVLWSGVIRGDDVRSWFPTKRWLSDLLIGVGFGVVFTGGAWCLFQRIPALRRLEILITQTLDMPALRLHHALIWGLMAGIPEEILFRGAVQPALGWLAASLIFGALHSVTLAYFGYATIAGALLGGLAIWRGGLWAPIAAHVTIDIIMLVLLIINWRKEHSPTPARRV